MSTLIIGGLFVVALIALVALVFLLRSEGPASQASAPPAVPQTSDTTASQDIIHPSASQEQTERTGEPTVPEPSAQPAMANEHFHELSVELHTLHEQAQEIEHRLSVLSEMIERIEGPQDNHTTIAEGYSSIVDRQPAN